ncbi:MAG TPA: gliding motility-associated C-terminal domain-containing protein, partial [Bacteroidia bacterium]
THTLNATSNITPVNWIGNYNNGSTYTFNNSGFLVAYAQSPNGCITYDTLYYTANPIPNVNAGPDLHMCNNQDIVLTATGAEIYTWTPNIDNGVPFTQTSAQQMYIVTGEDVNGCIASDTVWVYTYQPVYADFNATPMTGEAPLPVSFINNSTGNIIDYLWDFGNGNTSNSSADSLNHEYLMPGQYTVVLTVSNQYCTDTISKTIIVLDFPKPTFKIPNIITPNNDGINDGFHLNLQNATDVQVYIYNRWGQLVGELNDINEQWYGINKLGQEVVEGVYYFVYEIYGKDNSVVKGDGFFHVVK